MTKQAPSKKLRNLIIAKVVLVLCAFAWLDRGFYVGDRTGSAADAPAKTDEKPAEKGAEKKADGDAKVIPAAEVKDAAAAAAPKRKSFLDDLLTLPKLDPETVKKDDLGKFLELAERKRQQVDSRVEQLKQRESQLQQLEKSIDGKLLKLEEERKFFATTLQKEKDLKGERMDKLIALYEKMEPKKAAPVIEQMDKDMAVELFKRLNQKQVTKILEVMSPEKSVKLSEYYARIRSGKEYDVIKELNKSLTDEFNECKGMTQAAH